MHTRAGAADGTPDTGGSATWQTRDRHSPRIAVAAGVRSDAVNCRVVVRGSGVHRFGRSARNLAIV